MYETNESKIDWNKIIKRSAIILGAVLVIFAIVALIMKLTKRTDTQEEEKMEPYTMQEQLDKVENALMSYLDENSMPREINDSKTIRLKMLKDKGLIEDLTDKENNTCDINNSFAEITKFEDNYAVNISLTCGSNKENRLIYVGCFSRCEGKVCKGTSEETGGTCPLVKTDSPVENTNNNNTNSSDKSSTSTKNESNKSNKNTKPSSSSKPNTSNNTSKPKDKVEAPKEETPVNKVLYEYKRCHPSYSCKSGKITSDNKCEVKTTKQVYGNYSVSPYKSKTLVEVSQLNTYNSKYLYNGFYGGYHQYFKYSCDDASYTFDFDNKKCYKTVEVSDYVNADVITSCDYTWSNAEQLDGWVRTGNSK